MESIVLNWTYITYFLTSSHNIFSSKMRTMFVRGEHWWEIHQLPAYVYTRNQNQNKRHLIKNTKPNRSNYTTPSSISWGRPSSLGLLWGEVPTSGFPNKIEHALHVVMMQKQPGQHVPLEYIRWALKIVRVLPNFCLCGPFSLPYGTVVFFSPPDVIAFSFTPW